MELTLKLPFLSGKADPSAPLLSDKRAQLVDLLDGGKHGQAVREGRVFIGNAAAAGVVLPIYSNTTQVFGLWNPKGSGVNVELLSVAMTYVDTTGAAGGYCLGVTLDAPAQLATGARITAFTEAVLNTTIFNALTGSLRGPVAKFTPSAATVTAPILWRQLGLNQLVLTPADATQGLLRALIAFDGDAWLPPGTAVWLAGNIATLAKWAPTLVWKEETV